LSERSRTDQPASVFGKSLPSRSWTDARSRWPSSRRRREQLAVDEGTPIDGGAVADWMVDQADGSALSRLMRVRWTTDAADDLERNHSTRNPNRWARADGDVLDSQSERSVGSTGATTTAHNSSENSGNTR
jgi:hypothetical protein